MKINLLVLLGLFFISNSLSAKNIDVEIKSQSCFVEGDSLMVSIKYMVNAHDFASNEALTLIPVIKENRQEKELPPVLLNGKKRHRTYERNRVLNKRKGIKGDDFFLVKELAEKEPCIIVGRCADVILKDYHPLNLFVYADAESKIQRCIDRAPEGEHLSRNDIARRMKQVDKNRAQYRQMFADNKWGAKETYHLCVNTSGHEIKDLIPGLAAFVRCWFGEK